MAEAVPGPSAGPENLQRGPPQRETAGTAACRGEGLKRTVYNAQKRAGSVRALGTPSPLRCL